MTAPTSAALRGLAQELELLLSEPQSRALLSYLELLQRWNSTYNLTAVREPSAMFTQHLADCLAIIKPLRRHMLATPSVNRMLDVGSGGGLPGIVIAIMQPECQVTCVDTVGKKVAFITQVAGNLALNNLRAVHSRVEALGGAPFDVITSRAFASLPDMCRLTGPRLSQGGVWLAMKGRVPDDEIKLLPQDIEVFHVEHLDVPGLDAQRCLVWMRRRAPGLA